jgi:hypothetical protein
MNDPETTFNPSDSTWLEQNTTGDRNQAIGQNLGGIVINVSGGQPIINASGDAQNADGKPVSIGSNLYKSLMAFQDTDSEHPWWCRKLLKLLWIKDS